MASWHQWVEDKVKDSLDTKKRDYTSLIPQRNPNDPADRALKAAGAGLYSGVAGAVPERVGQAIQQTGLAPETGTAIRNFGEGNKIPANYPTGWERGIHRAAEGFAPNVAIPAATGMTGIGMIPGALASTAINQLSNAQTGREADLSALRGAIPNELAPSHTPGNYPLANAALSPQPAPALPTPEPRPAPIYVGGGGGGPGGGPGPNTAIRPGEGAAMPTEAIPGTYNELTRWDMARGLRNNGVNVPTMNREEMVAALKPKAGVGGMANVGTQTDDQLRDLMDRRGLNYFKMTDDQMRKIWNPIEQKNQANRPAALFTGDEARGGNGGAPASPEDRRNMGYAMLQRYMQNPEQYGPHYGQSAINAIHAIGPDIELPENLASQRELQGANAEYSRAHAGLVPSEIAKNEALSGHYKSEGENKPFLVPPGYEAYQTAPTRGNPATKIATGATEKASNPDAMARMSEPDKIAYTAAWHGYTNALDDKDRQHFQTLIDHISNKYNPAAERPKMTRDQAVEKMKATGKYSQAQIDAKLKELGL